MHRIYLRNYVVKNSRLSITGDKAHYLTSVLRCIKGDDLIIFDGEGNCFKTFLIKSDKKEVIAEVTEKFPCDLESPLDMILMQGLLKGEKMDLIIQKTVELGVKEIIPVITVRGQIRETKKTARWRKIAEEAARQSGRSMIPVIHEPVEIKKSLDRSSFDQPGDAKAQRRGEVKGFIFWEEKGFSLNEAIKKISVSTGRPFTGSPIHLLIGPEGGFTKEEVTFAQEKGLIVTSFGRRILRAETAAIAAVTLVQFLFGDMG
jgi:16S rRNA (uracil1498-N3)-methyltransferase